MPSFFVVQIIISFVNPAPPAFQSKIIWERAGVHSGLFWLNFVLLLFYAGLFATAWLLGQFHEDESSELSHFKKAEKRVQEGIVRLETVFELHGADSLDVQTFFHKWKETTDKLRAREDTINRRRLMRTPQHDERRVPRTAAGARRSTRQSVPSAPSSPSSATYRGRPRSRSRGSSSTRRGSRGTGLGRFLASRPCTRGISQQVLGREQAALLGALRRSRPRRRWSRRVVEERSLVQLSGGKYVADLRTMTQKNQQTSPAGIPRGSCAWRPRLSNCSFPIL